MDLSDDSPSPIRLSKNIVVQDLLGTELKEGSYTPIPSSNNFVLKDEWRGTDCTLILNTTNIKPGVLIVIST